jgi:hypothetical protein
MPLIVQEWILNEESWHARPSTSINKVMPVHRNDNKNKVKCYYCNKPRHKSPDCWKKKCDEKEKKEKEKEKAGMSSSSGSTSKSVNVHIQVMPTSATIEEISDNEDIHISLQYMLPDLCDRDGWLTLDAHITLVLIDCVMR